MQTTPTDTRIPPADAEWLEVVRRNVAGLRFGSIQITVHDGRVTQVESVEKTRFVPQPGTATPK